MEYELPKFKTLEQELLNIYKTPETRSDMLGGIIAAQVILLTYEQSGRELEAAEGIAKKALTHGREAMYVACAMAIEQTESMLYCYLSENRVL